MEDQIMYRFLKTAHLLGLAMFLGSILSHVVTGIEAGQPGAASFLFARQDVSLATQILTMPGLLLTIASGFAMAAAGRLPPLRQPWLGLHAGLGLLVLVLAVGFLAPTGRMILRDAAALVERPDPAIIARVLMSKQIESVAGVVNLVLTLLVVSLGVWKPRRLLVLRRHVEAAE